MKFFAFADLVNSTLVLALVTKIKHEGCELRFPERVRHEEEGEKVKILANCRDCKNELLFDSQARSWRFKK